MSRQSPAQIVLRLVLGGAFLWAGGAKLLHPDEFAPLLLSYQILPLHAVDLVALWLPACEVLIAICLLAGIWVRAAALLFSALMLVFIAGIAQALARGIELHCGCFSTEATGPARTWISLWEEVALLGMGLGLWWSHWEGHGSRVEGRGSRVGKRRRRGNGLGGGNWPGRRGCCRAWPPRRAAGANSRKRPRSGRYRCSRKPRPGSGGPAAPNGARDRASRGCGAGPRRAA